MEKTDKLVIGERVRNIRLSMGLSRDQLSELLGISALFLGYIECGQRGMSLDTLCSLCKTLNVSADYILFGKTKDAASENKLQSEIAGFDSSYYPFLVEQLHSIKKMIALIEHRHQLSDSNNE